MVKLFFILCGLILICVAVFALTSNKNVDRVPFNPYFSKDFKRLPDDLTPYCCGEVVNSRCTGKVDLDRAVSDIEKGMNPSFVYDIDKSSLNCGVGN